MGTYLGGKIGLKNNSEGFGNKRHWDPQGEISKWQSDSCPLTLFEDNGGAAFVCWKGEDIGIGSEGMESSVFRGSEVAIDGETSSEGGLGSSGEDLGHVMFKEVGKW